MGMHGNNSKQKIGNQRIILRDEDCTIMSEQQSRMKLNPLVQSTYCTVFYLLLSFKHVNRIKLDVRCLATVVTLF